MEVDVPAAVLVVPPEQLFDLTYNACRFRRGGCGQSKVGDFSPRQKRKGRAVGHQNVYSRWKRCDIGDDLSRLPTPVPGRR